MLPEVQPYTTKLNQANAYWMARFSKDVYDAVKGDNADLLKSYNFETGTFKNIIGFDNNSAQAMFVEHKDYLCMAFRGTDEIADWLDNLNAFCTKELFGEFHRGFWLSLEDVWDDIFDC